MDEKETAVGELFQNRVIVSNARLAAKLHGKRAYGSMEDKTLHLSLLEAYYLVSIGKIEVREGTTMLSLEDLRARAQEDSEFSIKYPVYKDLRDRTYIVKTGFKYGCHFRVYRNTVDEHAEYLVHVLVQHGTLSSDELMTHVRLAHSVKKTMVLALLDEENDINYYAVDRLSL